MLVCAGMFAFDSALGLILSYSDSVFTFSAALSSLTFTLEFSLLLSEATEPLLWQAVSALIAIIAASAAAALFFILSSLSGRKFCL